MRGILRGFGLKVGAVTRKSFELRVRELMEGQSTLTAIMEGMLNSRAHRMWVDLTEFRFSKEEAAVPALITAK